MSYEKIPVEERLNFYLNDLQPMTIELSKADDFTSKKRDLNRKALYVFSFKDWQKSFALWYCNNLIRKPFFRNIRSLPYLRQGYKSLFCLMDFFPVFYQAPSLQNQKYLLFLGERGYLTPLPTFRKAREANDTASLIFKFDTLRHFFPCREAAQADCAWEEKANKVIWRGATTGENVRADFVSRYADTFDVGFSSVKQKPHLRHLCRPRVSIKQQLQNKFIVSLEGNELASNLKWILFSNSVPIMRKPAWHSWIMENKLQPYVHYLPLKADLSNLDALKDWADANDEECRQMAENGKAYMQQFFDEAAELKIQQRLLREYADRAFFR